MVWMNRWEVEDQRAQRAAHPVLGPATQFLYDFMREVDAHSDGWPYWAPPARAAAKLMQLIQDQRTHLPNRPPVTDADVRKALAPIKAFMTRRGTGAGMTLPSLRNTGTRRDV